jgi:hypothetical protein
MGVTFVEKQTISSSMAGPENKSDTQAASTPGIQHVIMLLQPSKHDSTRFYRDFRSLPEAIDG